MAGYNFFAPFKPVKKKRNYKKLILTILVFSMIMPIVYYHWNMLIKLNELNSEIKVIEAFVDDPKNASKVEMVENKQKQVDNYMNIRNQLKNSESQINSEFQAAAYLLDLINDQIPNELFLTNLTLDDGVLSMEGYSQSFEIIAQYAYNLRATGMFTDIEIPNVVNNESSVYFTLVGSLKWEGANETEQ